MKRTWSKRSLASLQGIHPDLRRVMDRALSESPVDFTVIEGLRTQARQRELVAKGASKTMNSRHITGHAVDLLPHGPDGKGAFDWPLYHRLAPAVKSAAKAEGVTLVWGGDWRSFKDGPHFELDRNVYPAGAPDRPQHPGAVGPSTVKDSLTVGAAKPVPTSLQKAQRTPANPATGLWAALLRALVAMFTRK